MSQFPMTPVPDDEPEEKESLFSRFSTPIIAGVLLILFFGGIAIKTIGFSGIVDIATGNSNKNAEESVVHAKIGDCINEFDKVNDAKIVDCGSPEAKNRVVGVLESVGEMTFDRDDSLCDKFPDTEQAIWYGRITGDVWCIAAVKPEPAKS